MSECLFCFQQLAITVVDGDDNVTYYWSSYNIQLT